MANPYTSSYRQILHHNHNQFELLIQNGDVKPLFLWHFLLVIALPVSALLIPQRRGARYVRPVVFIYILNVAVDFIRHRRALLGANGYMVGLVSSWWAIWSGTLLIFNDVESDFKRVERRSLDSAQASQTRDPIDGVSVPDDKVSIDQVRNSKKMETLVWQPYPTGLLHRLNWTLGLLFNMRGPEWNWRLSSCDPLPPSLHPQQKSQNGNGCRPHKDANDDHDAARTRLATAFSICFKSYLALDLIKVLMMRDPYFLGAVSPPPPPPFPFNYLPAIPIVIRFYRILLSLIGIFTALTYISSLNPIVFLGLSLAFPNASRALTSAPLDASWMYAVPFGPFLDPILEHGLAGCWGQWWHQYFRFGFTAPAISLLSLLPADLSTRPNIRRGVMALVAFSLSGLIHACGSYTQLSTTNPISGTFFFFVLQPLGIILQDIMVKAIRSALLKSTSHKNKRKLPRRLRRTANALFVFAWLFFSGRFIADDFSRGGLWLTEPLPMSFIRGLGLANLPGGWWCWEGPWFRSWDDGGFWGVRVM